MGPFRCGEDALEFRVATEGLEDGLADDLEIGNAQLQGASQEAERFGTVSDQSPIAGQSAGAL